MPAERLDDLRARLSDTACPERSRDLFPPPPPSWVGRVYNCVRRVDLPAGGHVLAYERPADFVAHVREAFRPYR